MHLQTSGMFYIIFVIAKQRLAQILRNAISLRWRAGIFNLDTGLRDVMFPFRAWLQPTACEDIDKTFASDSPQVELQVNLHDFADLRVAALDFLETVPIAAVVCLVQWTTFV